jgi:hypothetical protein
MDEYLAPVDGKYWYRAFDNGLRDFSAGEVMLRYTVTGRNAASSSYELGTDTITLLPVPALRITGPSGVKVGQHITLSVDYVDFESFYQQPHYLLWTVENPHVLSADQNGVVTGRTPGATDVRVRSQLSKDATATVTIVVS